MSRQRKPAGRSQLPASFEEILHRISKTPGWSYHQGGKHIKVVGPGGVGSSIPITTSDRRALANQVAQLRHVGLDVRRPAQDETVGRRQ